MYKLLWILFLSGIVLHGDLLPKVKKALSADLEREKFLLKKIDKLDSDGMIFIKKYLTSDFGLYAYKANYILPFSYASKKYLYWDKDGAFSLHEKQYETEFQISLRKPVLFNLLGLDETLTLAYTQRVFWQIYSTSSPFRENNYEPEIYMTFPTSTNFDREYGLKGLRTGFLHQSNGQDGLQSRSWNRLYLSSIWQYKSLFTSFRVWYRIPEEKKDDPSDSYGDDNPDIEEYLGYGDITFTYIKNKGQFMLLLRNNFDIKENRGALELSYSYPLALAKDSFLYFKFFNGYGESLIDYDRHMTKAAFGFSFSRGLF
jgi:phospholipase A1